MAIASRLSDDVNGRQSIRLTSPLLFSRYNYDGALNIMCFQMRTHVIALKRKPVSFARIEQLNHYSCTVNNEYR